jgi:glycosyltransferase involved in cell wall biosynthesis
VKQNPSLPMPAKITFIVPIYRAEPYLRRCVDSIVRQTCQNLEIILIDDGSPDRCGEIADDYARRDPRVRVIHQRNQGQSVARNAGLDAMSGDYVAFVDADDWINEKMAAELLAFATSENADITLFGHCDVMAAGEKNAPVNFPANAGIDEIRYRLLLDRLPTVPWDKLYCAALFTDLRFPVGVLCEDLFIMPELFFRATRVAASPGIYYYYDQLNANSTMSNRNSCLKYGLFFGWAERERQARKWCPRAIAWSEYRAARGAISALALNLADQRLSVTEVKTARHYLAEKRAGGLAVGGKYRAVWWALDHCPALCRFYARAGLALAKCKNWRRGKTPA